ncbi:hypothetical protein GR160_08025 [Flavobacterium sp. Sd200]|uniref:hypothetical protein n=1 Tax=Flavobacterium sp. Sd200 TaxID=2692211 RepID=UPI00144B630E|nr:hypothetical protein [Flavobacterium sp. Sd200]MXN91176.1 hypothetical protein [Flavobacterium sp. Sd200]
MMDGENDTILPEKAMKLLRDDGIDVNLEQATIILHFLSHMAEIVADQYLDRADIL